MRYLKQAFTSNCIFTSRFDKPLLQSLRIPETSIVTPSGVYALPQRTLAMRIIELRATMSFLDFAKINH